MTTETEKTVFDKHAIKVYHAVLLGSSLEQLNEQYYVTKEEILDITSGKTYQHLNLKPFAAGVFFRTNAIKERLTQLVHELETNVCPLVKTRLEKQVKDTQHKLDNYYYRCQEIRNSVYSQIE